MAEKKKKLKLSMVTREARDIIWHRRGRLLLGFVLIVISRLASLVMPASSKFLIDEVIGNGRAELLMWLAMAIGTATVIQAASTFALSQILSVAAQQAITEMRKKVEKHVIRLPVTYFDSTKSGTLLTRIMNDAEGIRNLIGTGLVQLIGGLLTATVALTALFYLNWRLTSITLVVLLSYAVLMFFFFKKLRPLFRERGEIQSQVSGRLGEALGGVRVVKAYTAEEREDRIFAGGVDKLQANVAKSITSIATVASTTQCIIGVISLLMIIIGGRDILSGAMTLGDFVSYIFFTAMVATPLIQISSISTQIAEAFAGLDRIRELQRLTTEIDEDRRRETLDDIRGDVTFEDVFFEYEEDVPVLKGVSFNSPAGTTTALVGSSGSGKSTLISLVMAFNNPKSGRVLIDGHDISQVSLASYRSRLGVVLQDNFLFDGTIVENIGYAHSSASREQIEAAAKVAHCEAFVSEFEDGYDTVVGERGVKLSGGQRQRIAIARAILADPSILILDEATSSLDSESEAMIQDGLERLRRGRTTFVIAHRLSTIQSADQILVLEDG
ncbi:MAG: ABC transporter ATP-binding protein, partial [Acidobacteriota bacterium]